MPEPDDRKIHQWPALSDGSSAEELHSADTIAVGLRQQLVQDGFVAIRGFLSDNELSAVENRLDEFIRTIVPKMPTEHVFYEQRDDVNTLKQLQQMAHHDPWFQRFNQGRVFRLARALMGEEVIAKNLQYFNKPPQVGAPTPAHQDGFYFMLNPCRAITMWLALDHVNAENGCIRYVRGSHKRGMRPHRRTTTLGFSQGIEPFPTEEDRVAETAIYAEPGDLLVHDALTIHWADGNQSLTRTRRALGLIFYSAEAQEDREAKRDYQKQLTEEMKSAGQIADR